MSVINTTTPDLAGLAGRLRGTVALPGKPGYELATPFNVAVAVRPRAVVAVADAQDVLETVRFAGDNGLRVVPQRTGHGAIPTGDDVLLVHTGGLDELTIDPETAVARVGAGVIWQQVVEAAAPFGLAPSLGSAPGVGVAGYLTGGGVGPLVRTHGLSSDLVRAFELVTGDGQLLRATADEHPDLFWALRGGKGTVGIVVAAEVELLPVETVHGGALFFDGADAAVVLRAWAEWAPTLPEHANTSLALMQLPPLPTVPPPLAGRFSVAVRWTSVADDATAEAALAPMRAVATPVMDTVGRMPFTQIGMVHADPTDPMPVAEASTLLRELPAEAVDALLAVAGPEAGSPQVIVELRLLGGALAREPEHADAFCHRGAAFSLMSIGVLAPEIAAIVPRHGQAVMAALDPWSTGGLMPNFAPATDAARMARAYDEDTRAWLSALAERHDPAGVLRAGLVVRD